MPAGRMCGVMTHWRVQVGRLAACVIWSCFLVCAPAFWFTLRPSVTLSQNHPPASAGLLDPESTQLAQVLRWVTGVGTLLTLTVREHCFAQALAAWAPSGPQWYCLSLRRDGGEGVGLGKLGEGWGFKQTLSQTHIKARPWE